MKIIILLVAGLLFTGEAAPQAQRVRFQRGRSSSIVKGTVHGEKSKIYLVAAKEGQKMSLSITKGAGFRLSSPSGPLEGGKLVSKSQQDLVASGDYEIEVSSLSNRTVVFSLEIVIQ